MERSRDRAVADPAVVGAVAVGGALGAAGRYGLVLLWPTPPEGFPWATLWTNVAGCALIGVFLVVITEVRTPHRLLRPFFATGVLGGFTTFSTYAVEIEHLVAGGAPGRGLAYLMVTLVAALGAVWLAARTTRRLLVPAPAGGTR
ncbi:fluoride efflux transporter FluC [Streptomyces sp. SP18CS02]|uniref:fluoride efflux transporter FluC n=1 Tax=Streptomyces sp. SP18CS02 TaxID=3002531 RepID=UPI002E75BA2C|nr:CrcB family protein [Streptomyces sp. SP18CS02]MEE1753573.1 CrcB family protein [Streptomyces sp. SP18CS02]